MNKIYFTFANDRQQPLPSLKEEDEQVSRLIARREAAGHLTFGKDSFAELPRVLEYLLMFRNHLMLFMFSGHAGHNRLLLEDSPANAKGIAQLLGRCPKLKVVILNGCSTRAQVAELHQNGVPVVISTSAPIEDKAASQFSTSFFQSLCEQNAPLEQAFDAGIEAAQAVSKKDLKPEKSRSLFLRSIPAEEDHPLWSISYRTEKEEALYKNWTLPTELSTDNKEPNEALIDSLMQALAPFNRKVEKALEDWEFGMEQDISFRREMILKYLPFPISEQLRKLVTPKSKNQLEVFFDEPGKGRLQQIITTYSTTIEFITFVLLAQLWDELFKYKKQKKRIETSQLNELKSLFQLKTFEERKCFDFLPILQTISQWFQDQEGIKWFMPQVQDLIEQWESSSRFAEACQFLDTVKTRLAQEEFEEEGSLSNTEAELLSILAEEELAAFFEAFGFLAQYTLTSINEISVTKNRLFRTARYDHKLFRLIQQFKTELTSEPIRLSEPLSNNSVLLIRWEGKADYDFSEFTEEHLLNLSPFVIDSNAFKDKAITIKLHFFDLYQQHNDSYIFKHAYKPNDVLLIDNKQAKLRGLRKQFDNFSTLVFQKRLKAL